MSLAYDIDGDDLSLTATGGPLKSKNLPASSILIRCTGNDTVITTFTWKTTCSHVQNQPYQLFFKASDFDYPGQPGQL
ncbi:MAG: hypothetical protein MZV63_16965 [Marinilabiliales bacterium]|nr:hypothetical protein [Marinilabiliales bacterium]